MKPARKLISLNVEHPETLLLAIGKDGTMRIGLPPRDPRDGYPSRAAVVGKLGNVSHVTCSPEGELFCVRDKELYKGPIQAQEGVDWFSVARRVGKCEWSEYKIIFFHPNGELYGTTKNGEFYKGPQPNNENVPWLYGQATKIGASGWEKCEALFFNPSGVLFAVTKQDNIVKSMPPTSQDFKEWMKTVTVAGGSGWCSLTHFMAFCPCGDLWCIEKGSGNIYRGSISDNDKGQSFSKNPEVIEERVYDNRRSSSTLKHTFTFDKTVKSSSSFSHEHGFTVEVGASLKFKAGIPCITETEAKVEINVSTTDTWSFTETNETERLNIYIFTCMNLPRTRSVDRIPRYGQQPP